MGGPMAILRSLAPVWRGPSTVNLRWAALIVLPLAGPASLVHAQDGPAPPLPEGQVAVPVTLPTPRAPLPAPSTAPVPDAAPTAARPEPCPPAPEDSWVRHRGARLTGGFVLTQDVPNGAFGRLELETYSLRRSDETFVSGVLVGLEGWGTKGSGGGGIPMVVFTGYREDTSVFATLGAGWSWAIYDKVGGDGGFGVFAPIVALSFGLDLEGVRILADGRATYRWQWDAPDFYQVQAGLTFSVTSDH